MGLDISPGNASWSYHGFNSFRARLAHAEGFNLREMEGFKPFDMPADQWHGKSWDGIDSPLVPLLNHSDCDGYLSPWDCERIIPRLREIISSWPGDDYDRRQAEALIGGMTHCVDHGCALWFH